ncbi:hypothetical protein [Marisediminitalea sp.]|uniref:hypothetical protein n=1 Tax=Marisediminitalea sp. TaxID=2662268 RepID=UPI0035129E9D
MNVILHVGPGKTGSSAIQKWLNEHSDTLLSEGVFYPEHSLDENGVSSGNALSIFEYDSKGQLHFSESKAKFLLENARAKQCHTLLLSSEAFIARFEPVLHFFDRCKVIFYLRNPVECAESLYNQSVKRHYNCNTIQVPSEVSFSRLLKLSQTIKNKKDGQLSVRLYGARFFNGGNIIRDFTSTIGLTANMDGYDKQINGSYSFPALEFKRWFNLVPISAVHHRLDRFLQQYCGKTEQFSLYTKKQYEEFKALSINALEDLFKNIGVEGDKQFLEEVKQSSQARVFEQGLGKDCLTDLVQKIKSEDKHLYSELSQIALSSAHPDLRDGVIGKAFSGVRNPLGRKLRPVSLSFRKKLTVTDCFSSVPVSVVSKEHLQWIRDKLKLANNIDDGILLRDFALFHEELGNIDMAYYFMREARRYRPHGVIILGKLKEYSDSLYSKQM